MDQMKESKAEEFVGGDLCRLCANTDQQLIPIFQGEGIEHNIPEQIEKYLPIITVTQKDELPLQICYQCTSTLIAWHNFFEQCRTADNRLREVLPVNIKFNQDDESCHDYTDHFHDDLEDEAVDPDVECILIEPKDDDILIPSVDKQIPTVEKQTPTVEKQTPTVERQTPTVDRQIPKVNIQIPKVDEQIPTVSNVQTPAVSDVQIMETSGNETINVSKNESKSETENLDDSRNAESVEERGDPLTITPQTCPLLAEDRAKLVKSKKLGPLMRKCKEVDVTILECDRCSAFFIDSHDFEKHKSTHLEVPSAGGEPKSSLQADATNGLSAEVISKSKDADETKSSSYPKLRIKIGSDPTRRTSAKKKSKVSESSLSTRSSKLTKNRISQNSADTSTENNRKKQKRKLDATKSAEMKKTEEDVDSSPKKKRKKSSKHDDSEAKSLTEGASSVSPVKSDVNSCTSDRIRVADVAKGECAESENADSKSVQSKKGRPRRATKEEEDDEICTCAHCLRTFRRKSNLKRHMVKLHYSAPSADIKTGPSSSKWFTGYCCDVCGEGLQHRPTMMAHRDVLHGAESEIDWVKYRTSLARVKFCPECKKYFRAGSFFEEHSCDRGQSIKDVGLAERVRSAEEVRPKFMCSLCNDYFRWKWDLRLHCETEHDDAEPIDWTSIVGAELRHLCEQCLKAYPSDDELAAHQCAAKLYQQPAPSEDLAKQFRCDVCHLEYFWKSDYRRHMRLKHPKESCRPTEHDTIVYTCPYCGDKFTLRKGVLQHMRKAHDANSDSPFVCVKCNKVFRRRDNLERHNESYHPAVNDQEEVRRILDEAEVRINGDITYHCSVCSRKLADSYRFIAHYRGHTSENKFKCDLCDKQTRTQHQLNTHIKNIHLKIRNYRCDLCEKTFYTKQACEEHRRIHTGERPFSCEICGKTFIAGNALISHKRFHNDFYPHSCHLCPKKFKVRRSLVNHVRTHTGERPFECDLCLKTFNNSSQFSYHKKVTHSEDRPFACPICGNCFKANKFLTRHMELHIDPTPKKSRKTKKRASGTNSVAEGVQPAADAIVEQRGIKIFVSAPTVVPAAPLVDVPSIVSVVSTVSTTVLKEGNPVGLANVGFQEENILPGPHHLFDGDSEYDQYGVKGSGDVDPTTFMTTVEYIQMADDEFKPLISDDRFVSAAPQPDSGRSAGAKNITWL